MHQVVALVVKEVVAFDLAIPAQVFGLERERYAWDVCAPGGPCAVATETGFGVLVPSGLEALQRAGTVVVPGIGDRAWPVPEEALDSLRAAAERGARVVSICTGAFVLAAAGLLDGRRATTHWRYADRLAQLFPAVNVDPKVLFIEDGNLFTSAGVTAGIDLCLHIVRRDHGAEVANAVARRMVVAAHRDGGQAQFIERPVPTSPDQSLGATREWMLSNLTQRLTIEAMASHAGYSPRTFERRFLSETGVTPLRWLVHQRVAEAQRLLERTTLGVDVIAARAGLGAPASLRKHFARTLGISPTTYRRAFRARPVDGHA